MAFVLEFEGIMGKKSVTFVIPVYNEEIDLSKNVPDLYKYLDKSLGSYKWEILIADNASVDNTKKIGKKLAKDSKIKYIRIPLKGRGRALKKSWLFSKSDYLFYMDVDLSSDLKFISKLLGALDEGADIAIGSRLAKGAKVYGRTATREFISRSYSLMFRSLFFTHFKDAQCGFKAIKRSVAEKVLPVIKDTGWFFDSELLITAEKAGFEIAEIPIVWHDDPDSTVKVVKTARGDIEGLIRLLFTRPWRKLK